MRFSFRLQSLLNWKESREEASQTRLARKHHLLERQKKEIQELADRREENDRGLRKRMGKGLFAREYMVHKQFNEESYQNLVQMESNQNQIEQEIMEERNHLTGLMKERKILEKLKEKRFKTFLNQMGRLEQKDLDEMATRAYCRRVHPTGND